MSTRSPLLSRRKSLKPREGATLAYPEPIPAIRGKQDIEEFYRRLKQFKLTAAQKKMYRDAIERYEKHEAQAKPKRK
jgi:hypothetical protein